MDRQTVYSLSLFGSDRNEDSQDSHSRIQQQLVDFILDFRLDNVFIYR
jgi:DNA replication licensing factor MCM5